MYISIAILFFAILIFVHELGHFVTAKWANIKVHQFAIGMGPSILKWGKGETKYAIKLLPIGGFVQMEGEDGESSDERSFGKAPIYKRFIVLVAGSFMNIMLGIILSMTIMAMTASLPSNTVAEFDANALSDKSGLQKGDNIVSINGSKTYNLSDINYIIIHSGGKPIKMEVIRDNKKVTLSDVKFPSENVQGMTFSFSDFKVYKEKKTVLTVTKHGFFNVISTTREIWRSLYDMVTGKIPAKQMSGVVGVTQAASQAAKMGLKSLLLFFMFITINIGVFNLFPFPALDGGRIVFLLVELIRRKPVSPKIESYVNIAGFALLMLLVIFVTYNDILRIFTR